MPARSLVTALALILFAPAPAARAQLSLAGAVDLALRSNPRVLGAQDDVKRAMAQIDQAIDAYIPSINMGAGIGQAYGYLPNPPNLFDVTAGSLAFSASQRYYIRSARTGLEAARYAYDDVREAVAQDTALAFLTLNHDQQRAQAIHQQLDYANTLVTITQQRLDAGQDSQIDLTQAKLTAAKLRSAVLYADDDIGNDRDHLARLIGLPSQSLSTDGAFPDAPLPADAPSASDVHGYANSAVASAFANADAKEQQAKGDNTFRFWPQINFFTQYNRYATFTNSFKDLENIYKGNNGQTLLTANEFAVGIQISLPFFDKARSDKAREASAEAAHARHDAENDQLEALDGQSRARHSIDELQAQADVATLQQQLAQQQLDIVRQQLQSGTGNPNGPQMTPKDEQNARISERDKYIAVLDSSFQLRQAEIQLLRQTGQLLSWLSSTASAAPSVAPSSGFAPRP